MYVLDLVTLWWTKLNSSGQSEVYDKRERFSCASLGSVIYIFGGCYMEKECYNDITHINTGILCPRNCNKTEHAEMMSVCVIRVIQAMIARLRHGARIFVIIKDTAVTQENVCATQDIREISVSIRLIALEIVLRLWQEPAYQMEGVSAMKAMKNLIAGASV
jgi:hypothetical protein